MTFKPPLKEYYIISTAPDDVAMQELAREITKEHAAAGNVMRVFVWGWNTLEERISEDLTAGFARMESMFAEMSGRLASPPGDSTVEVNAVEAHLDAQIDEYRELNNSGKTLTAMPLLEKLLARVGASASGRNLFRIKANIGHCLFALGKDDEAAAMLLASFDHAPGEPKAITNKAFGLLLQGKWEELLAFGRAQLEIAPANESLAGYLVQATRFDMLAPNPLELVPEQLHQTAAVQLSLVDFVRHRGKPGEWWEPARAALAMHPIETHAVQFAAEADLDEILTSQSFQRMRVLSLTERRKLVAVTATLNSQWDREREKDGPLRQEDAALCSNVVVGLAALDEFAKALEVARQGLALAPDDHDILVRATMVAIESGDDIFAGELLPKLPAAPNSVVLKFRYHAARADWPEVVALLENNASLITSTEEPIITTTARLAAIKIGVDDPEERRRQIALVATDAMRDPRAGIVVADFARREYLEDIADAAFEAAVKQIDDDSHAADRLMVAHYANRCGDAAIVIDLLDGRVAEDHDSNELRMLARAFVNDSPIRQCSRLLRSSAASGAGTSLLSSRGRPAALQSGSIERS